jgi:hypothetical protein
MAAAGEKDFPSSGINARSHMFLKEVMGIDVLADNTLIEVDSLFTRRMQKAAGIHACLQIRMKLLTNFKVLSLDDHVGSCTSCCTCFPNRRNSSISSTVASLCL